MVVDSMAQKTVTTEKEVFFSFLPMSLFIARCNIMVYMIRHSCTQHCQNMAKAVFNLRQ